MLITEDTKYTNLIGKGKCITERHKNDIDTSKSRLVCEAKKGADGEYEYILEGIVASADENSNNGNGRRYELDDMTRAVQKYKELFVDEKKSFGELEHPQTASINMERISHIVTDIWMEGKDVFARIKLLDLPITKIIKEMLRVGSKIGISSRVLGDLYEMDGYTLVENIEIVAFDLVATPSNEISWLDGVLEEKEYVMDKNGVVLESKDYTTKVISDVEKSNKKLNLKYVDELSEYL